MTTFYRKVGRRYVPVLREHDTMGAMPLGFYLLEHHEHGHSMRPVQPKAVELEAAMNVASKAMLDAMRKADAYTVSHPQNDSEKTKARRLRAWKAYCDVMGPDPSLLLRCASHQDVIEAGLEAVREHIRKRTT